jgi:cellulose synthase/poly-beta-1,6-N-acetylglucosamine synthase-like glycosyltransferase
MNGEVSLDENREKKVISPLAQDSHAKSRAGVREFIQRRSYPTSRPEFHRTSDVVERDGEPYPFVIALIPAYNEQDSIQNSIESLRNQTRPPEEIIVVADNCTDDTIAIALAAGVSVFESTNNEDGKAGALNEILANLLPILDFDDCILVMDADTELTERFIELTTKTLFTESVKPIGGVGGIFLASDDSWNLVRQLQTNEYVRYQRRLARRRGRALVLTGTGTVFKAGVLREVQAARKSGEIADLGQAHGVYDISALTEDNELTISVKELGYRVLSPKECTVKTALMPNLASLFKQRRRWQRGALENILAHGVNRHTLPYLLRQILTYLGVLFLPFYVYTLTVALIQKSDINFFQPLWIAVAVVYILEQTFSVRKGGIRSLVVSISVIPEILMNVFLDIIYVICFFGTLFATDEKWGRMRHLQAEVSSAQELKETTPTTFHELSLHGTHELRRRANYKFVSLMLLVIIMFTIAFFINIPLTDLQLAWNIIAVYVLAGFVVTIGRLVPVKTF